MWSLLAVASQLLRGPIATARTVPVWLVRVWRWVSVTESQTLESELRFRWIEAWLTGLDAAEMRELVLGAWRIVMPQRGALTPELGHGV